VREIRKRAPRATVIVTGITPRDDNPAVMPVIDAANRQIATLADGKSIRYININEQLATPDGRLREGMAHGRPAPDHGGVPALGRRAETHPHRDPRAAGRGRPRTATHGRSQRRTTSAESVNEYRQKAVDPPG
jgi:hypothetical protein